MKCVSTVSFSIVLNGNQGVSFKPSRGLKQGDPISPNLFLLVSEVLSLQIKEVILKGSLEGIKLTRACPTLSHLFFADDSLFFLKATLLNYWNLVNIFSVFCTASG